MCPSGAISQPGRGLLFQWASTTYQNKGISLVQSGHNHTIEI